MITFVVMGIAVILLVFFAALFAKDKSKKYVSFIFTGIGYVTIVLLLMYEGLYFFLIGIPVMAILLALMLLNGNRAVGFIAWAMTGLCLAGFIISITSFDLFNIIRYELYSNIEGYRQNIVEFAYVASTEPLRIIFVFALFVVYLPLMISASVIRYKRRWRGDYHKSSSSLKTSSSNTYIVKRVDKSCSALFGNVLAIMSYVTIIIALRYLITTLSPINIWCYDNTSKTIQFNYSTQVIVCFVIGIICGGVSWLLLRYSRSYGYESNALGKAAYIWSWIPAIIIIALIIVTMLIICAATNVEFSTVANKKVYKVVDENGEVRTLDYNGKDIYAKCKDDKGEWWETADGGSTFRKCDLYKIKDDDGNNKYIRDVGGGGKRIFTDGQGGTYESDDGGMTVTEQKD